jgi:hypothetical protein
VLIRRRSPSASIAKPDELRVPLPQPVPGLVIRCSYLPLDEYRRGREEGVKDRPCAVVLVATTESEGETVTVLPVTHVAPRDPLCAMEIPRETKRRLGLDDEQSRIVMTEANRFTWPGPDLRPAIPGQLESVAYGLLPRAFFLRLRNRFLALIAAGDAGAVGRSE